MDGHGADRLDSLTLRDKRTGQAERVPADALFVLIVGEPCTQWLPKAVQLGDGYILTGRDIDRDGAHPSRCPLDRAPLPLETSIPRRLRGWSRPVPLDQAGRLRDRRRRNDGARRARVSRADGA